MKKIAKGIPGILYSFFLFGLSFTQPTLYLVPIALSILGSIAYRFRKYSGEPISLYKNGYYINGTIKKWNDTKIYINRDGKASIFIDDFGNDQIEFCLDNSEVQILNNSINAYSLTIEST